MILKHMHLHLMEYDDNTAFVTLEVDQKDILNDDDKVVYRMNLRIPQSIWPNDTNVMQHIATMALFNAWQEINTEISCPHADPAICVLKEPIIDTPQQLRPLNPLP